MAIDDRALGIFAAVLAVAIKDLDDWPDVTPDAFLQRFDQKLATFCQEEIQDLAFLEPTVRRLHELLLRAYDLHRDPKAPPRGTSH